ncbi:MAG: hypothetical protein K8R88_15355 [Armatimonadetes bacterium]|nr:hypothetical protein [Armatimonadota bacterium]
MLFPTSSSLMGAKTKQFSYLTDADASQLAQNAQEIISEQANAITSNANRKGF